MDHIPSREDIIKFQKFWINFKQKRNEIIDPVERFIMEQMHLFLGWSLVIKDIKCKDESGNLVPAEENSLFYRNMNGSLLRLMFESFIKIAYLHTAKTIEEKNRRLERLVSTLGKEYKKLLNVLKESSKHFVDLLNDLEEAPDRSKMPKDISVKAMIEETGQKQLYGLYSVACFYAHGNMDNLMWNKLWKDKEAPQPTLEAYPLIFNLAKSHLSIARDIWGNRYSEFFEAE